MSISRQNLTIVIVTFKSEKVIHECIKSIGKETKIIVVENSHNPEFKKEIEKKYENIECIISAENLGMGKGNNLGISLTTTDYVLILNPDVVLEKSTIDELFIALNKISDFAILAPISDNEDYPNYKINNVEQVLDVKQSAFEVESVDGFAMLINKKKMNKIMNFKSQNYFDENFFMYLENDDLCKRIKNTNEKIFIIPKAKINHLGGKAVNSKYKKEIESSRNWHWIWSKFYFNKKHFGYRKAFIEGFPNFFSSIVKYMFYFLTNNKEKKIKYLNRASGFFNAALGKTSWYRPNINF
jgi:N-acetylglucosaminyl-diphospho-decaprenol L-rhamnosyltransferase